MTAFYIISAALLIIFAAFLIKGMLGSRAGLTGKYDRLLERAAEQGLVIPAEVISLDAVKTQKLELKEFERSQGPFTKRDLMRKAYHNMQDYRVSYRPTVRILTGGRKQELAYFRYVSDRELHLQEGQTVRICIDLERSQLFVIVGDKAAYSVLTQIVK